jgi:hypothetical protein
LRHHTGLQVVDAQLQRAQALRHQLGGARRTLNKTAQDKALNEINMQS